MLKLLERTIEGQQSGNFRREMVDRCGKCGQRAHSDLIVAGGGRAHFSGKTPRTVKPFNSG